MTRLAALVLLWMACFAGTFPVTFTVPTVACDGSPEPGPLYPVLTLKRCDGRDTTFTLPSRMPGQDVPFNVVTVPGHVYWIEARLRDDAGNLSCGYQSLMWTDPAIDEPPPPPPPDTSGTGITGDYYNGRSRSTWIATRRDTTIDFSWGNGSPMAGVSIDEFSAQWNGKLIIPTAGAWTLYLEVDDGGQVYEGVPGASNIRIDHMGTLPLTEWSWTGNMIAGEHGFAVVYQATTGNAEVHLKWSGPGVVKQVIPRGALR